MTGTMKHVYCSLCIVVWLTACGSSPQSNFYRLTPAVSPSPGGQEPSVGIGPIDIPEFLNRNALVYTREGNQVQIAGGELWAEPLDYGITRVMGINLSHLLGTEDIRFFPWDVRHAPEYGVRIRVLDLDARDGLATLVAEWVIYRPSEGAGITRRMSEFNRPLASAQTVPAQLPAAYSALLFQLSETIAAAIEEQRNKAAGTAAVR